MAEHRDMIRRLIEDGRHLVPPHMWGGVERHFLDRQPVGQFLTALLSNDLMEAFARADDVNGRAMQDWCHFLYNFAPSGSYGSLEKLHAWLADPAPVGEQDDG